MLPKQLIPLRPERCIIRYKTQEEIIHATIYVRISRRRLPHQP